MTQSFGKIPVLKSVVPAVCLAVALVSASVSSGQSDGDAGSSTVVIEAGQLLTMNGPSIENGMVIVRDGKIVAVGKDLEIPAEARRITVPVLMPGLVDAFSEAGVSGGNAEQTSEITPEFDVIHSIDWTSPDFEKALDSGTTTLHVFPGSDNVFAGGSCLIKVAGKKRIVSDHLGEVLSVCSDPVRGNSSRSRPDSIYVRQPTNRMGVVWIIRTNLFNAKNSTAEDSSATAAALRRIIDGKPVFAISRTSHDIHTVASLNDELGFRNTLVSAEEAWKTLDLIKERQMPVIYTGITTGSEEGNERSTLHWNTPGKMEEAEIPYCLAGGRLLEQARFAVRFGATPESALAAITSTPADILGMKDRIGSLQVGLDADLIALDGSPLEFTTSRLWTMIDGIVIDAPVEISSDVSDPEIDP